MRRLVIVLTSVLSGPMGCATIEVNDKYRHVVYQHVNKILSYSVEDQRVSRICVIGANGFYSEHAMEYDIRITPPVPENKCAASPDMSAMICKIGVPVTEVTGRDVTPNCKDVENSENYEAVIERQGEHGVFTIKAVGSDEIVSYISIGTLYYYTQPHYVVLNTLALLWDFVTFPVQLVLYFTGVIGTDWFTK